MAILGIETSCDETAIAVIDSPNKKVLCEALFSQIDLHNLYGGVVPELAARDHISRLVPLIKNEFEKNDLSFEILDVVAVSKGPGLRGPLLVGNTIANSIAYALKIELVFCCLGFFGVLLKALKRTSLVAYFFPKFN